VISTVVGGGQGGDGGPATSALLASPTDVACESHKNHYVVDQGLSNVRRVDAQGMIATVAGTTGGSALFSGDGGPATAAKLNGPLSIAFGPTGNLYIADSGNNRIRRVDRKGIITTVAGTGESGFSGDGGPATDAKLADPEAVAFDAAGNLYVDDYNTNRIRRVDRRGSSRRWRALASRASVTEARQRLRSSMQSGHQLRRNGNLLIADTKQPIQRRPKGSSRPWPDGQDGHSGTEAPPPPPSTIPSQS
jgi:sugar lactone lactonase YvrE